MFRSIWKGIKWFFSVKEKTHNSIGSKRGHIVKQPVPDAPIKVKGPGIGGTTVSIDSYNRMSEVYKASSNASNDDVIESAKRGLWVPHSLTEDHKKMILANCGFQKTVQTQDGFEYDPRLIQAINYAMNMYAGEVSQQVESILRQKSIVE